MESNYLYTENMAVGYDKKPLIEEIRLHVKRGEILTLIGPNGSGKSTILKSLIGQLSLIGGTVYLDGKAMHTLTEKDIAKKLSVVMTERMHPELMTCEDVVATGRYPYTGRLGILNAADKNKVREALELVDALDLADCDFTQISDGQRQRILLARAICQEPELIVLDEPTSFLDIHHKLALLTILKQMVQKRHVAVILSLHELDLAQKLSDYVLCIHNGQVEKYGSPEEIFTSSYIEQLYDMETGSYNALFGCVELAPVKAEPEVFVIAGNGTGIPCYRQLSRSQVPFATGILYENDVDYQVAKALASKVVSAKPFEPMGEDTFEKALAVMKSCAQVLCTMEEFGALAQMNKRLLEAAGETVIRRKH